MLCVLIMIRPYRRTLFFTFFVWIVGALWTFDTAGANDFCTCTINIRKSCDCVGNFSTFPPVPLEDFERLHLAHGRLRGINGTSLAHFGRYLTELSIAHMYNFTFIDDHALENLPKLKYIRISYTDLTKIPTLEGLGRIEPMNTISFDNNKIQEVQARGVRTVELLLDCNAIMVIEGWAFNGSEIHKLSLRGNKFLSQLSYHAFNGITKLKELDLSDTLVSSLPPIGLHELEVLKMKNTAALQTMPSILDIKRLQQAWMTYASQCCAFNPTCVDSWKTEEPKFASTVAIIARTRSDTTTARSISLIIDEITRNEKSDGSSSDETSVEVSEFHVHRRGTSYPTVSPMSQRDIQQLCNFFSGRKPVDCSWQQQDALNECDDLIASIWVKGSVWVVLLIALVGNVLVLLIVTLSHSEKTVARFLTCNLAFADLCMAVYLFLLATMDAISSKMYHNYAYLWQQGVGCKIAGFLTIFSCQLSFFTLSLLTMERWFSIKRALYSNLLDTRMTTMIMTCGWFYSLMMATLPLFGISSYSSASICLPMDIHDYPSLVYILVLIGTGGIAFLLMCFCYCQIYLSLRQETRHPKGGRSVARKIFILVATNFFCWSPIAFFALAAVTGHPLISTTKSKLLLLFIYPINSCANPYLYVIMTKQFKKDLIMLLARYGFCTQVADSRPMSHDTYQTTVNSTKSFVV